jgi:WD40 repeat protein
VGRGGLGVVLKGYDTRLKRIVAIKVPLSQFAANAAARRRFAREAEAAAAVSHDHVVTIHAVEPDRMPPYLVMEYIDGVSLQQKLDASGPLELREILRIGMQAARGLAAAHEQGLVHRDIKPANILLENGVQRVKITDFGLARAVDDVGMTQTGTVAGTPQYMSPEQAHGELVDHRSDLFSLGGVLYAMCTGRPPFRAETTLAVLKRVCDDTPKPIRNVNPEVPEWLCEIVDKLLEKDAGQRFPSAREVADLLGRHLAHLQQPESHPQPAPLARRHDVDNPAPSLVEFLVPRPGMKFMWRIARIVAAGLFGSLVAALTVLLDRVCEIPDDVAGPILVALMYLGLGLSYINVPLRRAGPFLEIELAAAGLACALTFFPLFGKYHVDIAESMMLMWFGAAIVDPVLLAALRRFRLPRAIVATAPGIQSAENRTSRADPSDAPNAIPRRRPLLIDLVLASVVVLLIVAGLSASGGLDRLLPALWRLTGPAGKFTLETTGSNVSVEYDGGRVVLSEGGKTTLTLAPGDYEVVSRSAGAMLSTTWHELKLGVEYTIHIPDEADSVVVRGPLSGPEKAARFAHGGTADRESQRMAAVDGPPDDLALAQRSSQLPLQTVFEITEVGRLDGHTDGINDVLVLSDGVTAISAAIDNTIRIWNIAEQRELHRLNSQGADADAVALAISPDERLLAAAHSRGAVTVWDLESREIVHRFSGPPYQIRDVAFVPDTTLIASITIDEGLSLWDYKSETEVGRYHALANANGLAALPDGAHLLIGFFSGRVALVRVRDGAVSQEFGGHPGGVNELVVSPDQRFLAAASGPNGDGSISIWDVESGALVQRLTGHQDKVDSIVYSPDGRVIISGSSDKTLRVWDAGSGREAARASVENHTLNHFAVTPDGTTIVTGGGTFWNGREMTREDDYSLRVWRIGDKPATSGGADAVGPIEIARSSHVFTGTLATGDLNVFALAFTQNGERAVTGQYGGKLVQWDVAQGTPIHSFEGHTGTIHAVAVSPDEQWLASGGEDSVIRLWNFSTGEPVKEFPGHTGRVMSLAFRDQGRELISMGCDFTDHEDNTIRIWDVETGQERGRITGDLKYPAELVLAPDGSWAAVSDAASGRVGLWDLASQTARHFFGGFATTPVSVALSSDGALLAAGYNASQQVDGKWDDPDNAVVRLWNADSGQLVHELRGHSGSILSVRFSPDDRYILSLGSDQHDESGRFIQSSDHTARIWDAATGKELVRFQIDRANVACWLPNGRSICTGTRIWDLPETLHGVEPAGDGSR